MCRLEPCVRVPFLLGCQRVSVTESSQLFPFLGVREGVERVLAG